MYAHFVSTTGLYEGDDVRVLGVNVGTVEKIEPGENDAKVTCTSTTTCVYPLMRKL